MVDREDASTMLVMGDYMIVVLRDIDDPQIAERITRYAWEGIDSDADTIDIELPDLTYDTKEPPGEHGQDT